MTDTQLLIEDADLIDGTGGAVIHDAMVLIEGERIKYAGPRTGDLESSPAPRWKLPGKSLIPGLIDAHTHSTSDADMQAYIRNGITTIRFAGLDLDSVARLKQRI